MKRKRLIRIFLLTAIIAGAAVAALVVFGSQGDAPSYRTERITSGDIVEMVSATGTLNPGRIVTVGSQVSGQVSKLYVALNDLVKAGDVLAEIDPTLLLAQIRQDRTALETARSTYEQAGRDLSRARSLLAQEYVARADVEHAEQAYRVAKNSYEAAKTVVERDEANLGYTKILAPIDGVVIAKNIDIGQTLASSFQAPDLFKIAADLTSMKIDVNLPEAFISKVKAGMEATFTVDALPSRVFKAKVTSVDVNPTNQNGMVSYNVQMAVSNGDHALLPGMTAYVNVILSKKENVLRVPAAALRFIPPPENVGGLRLLFGKRPPPVPMPQMTDSKRIYVLRNQTPIPVAVTTGAADENYVEISGDGIAEGDTVVLGVQKEKH